MSWLRLSFESEVSMGSQPDLISSSSSFVVIAFGQDFFPKAATTKYIFSGVFFPYSHSRFLFWLRYRGALDIEVRKEVIEALGDEFNELIGYVGELVLDKIKLSPPQSDSTAGSHDPTVGDNLGYLRLLTQGNDNIFY